MKHDDLLQLDYYIKSRKKELHGQVLENDDLPDVITKMNEVRQALGRTPYPPRWMPNREASNSDVQSSSLMHTNSMMSRQFFAF